MKLPEPGHPSVHGNAATANDVMEATPRASAPACIPPRRATAIERRPQQIAKTTIPVVTIHRFGLPSSASLLIASSTGSYPSRSAPEMTQEETKTTGPTTPA